MADPTLRSMRRGMGVTLNAAAQSIGVAVTYLSDVERGKRRLAPRHVDPLAKVLGYPPSFVAMVCGYCLTCCGTGKPKEPRR